MTLNPAGEWPKDKPPPNPPPAPPSPKQTKVTLTFLAQQYGMTVEGLQERYPGLKTEDIIVEPPPPGMGKHGA